MSEQVRQTAERLAGSQDALEIMSEEMARVCNPTTEQYLLLENDTVDISVSVLYQIPQAHGVELTTLVFGDESKMNTYFITRNGKGVAVECAKAYKYQSLVTDFVGRKVDPFLVTVHPKPEDEPMYLNSHLGRECNMVLKGRLLLQINNKDLTLEEGGSAYFNSGLPYGMKALDGEKVSFLTVIL